MTVSDKKEEYQQTLNESFKLLDENQEWIERYAGYISKINSTYFPLQCRFIREIVHINWPLAAYLNITSVTQSGMNLDLRLMGTSIATLYVQARTLETQDYNMIKSGNISAIDKSKLNQFVNISFKGKESAFRELVGGSSLRHTQLIDDKFICKDYWDLDFIQELLENESYSWNDPKVKKFRSIVKHIYDENGFVPDNEHAHESSMLHKMNGDSLTFNAIKPVLLEKSFFQMPTPFKGSKSKDDKIEYANNNGGGIDILARKKLGAQNELCVIEIKDHYEKGEEPIKAIKQAISYSGFLMRLIQSDSGKLWYEYFGMKSNPEKCNINAVIAMPFKSDKSGLTEEDTIFDGIELDAGNDCRITLRYIYYDVNALSAKNSDSSGVLISIPRDNVRK